MGFLFINTAQNSSANATRSRNLKTQTRVAELVGNY
jgi:hypothetical protein